MESKKKVRNIFLDILGNIVGNTEQCILGHIGINLSGYIGKFNQTGSTKFDQTYLIDNWKRENDSSDFTSTFRTFFPMYLRCWEQPCSTRKWS